jgi:tRNA pseudouridine55 synthase
MPRVVRNGIHGVLLLDKPLGLSSNAALQRVRRLFGWAKAGHTGTLDPLATGLLPVCVGEATKFSHALLDADKTYEAELRFGHTSSTGDAEGEITPTGVPAPSRTAVETTLEVFRGPQRQVPPMYSALKRNGRPLYEYARAGEELEREAREIVIREIGLGAAAPPGGACIRVRCSKGTYVRVLAAGARPAYLLPMDSLVQELPGLQLNPEDARRVSHGLSATVPGASPGLLRLYDPAGRFMGLGEARADGTLAPRRMVAESGNAENPQADAA